MAATLEVVIDCPHYRASESVKFIWHARKAAVTWRQKQGGTVQFQLRPSKVFLRRAFFYFKFNSLEVDS